jgi:hypothetical protein
VRPSFIASIVCLGTLYACGAPARGGSTSDASMSDGSMHDGRRCDRDVSGYEDGRFREPQEDIESPPVPQVKPDEARLIFWPAPGAHVVSSTFWLSDGEDLEMNIGLVLGSERSDALESRAIVMLDGLQQPLQSVSGGVGPYVELTVEAGTSKVEPLIVHSDAIGNGSHTMTILVFNRDGRLIFGPNFTVIKGHPLFEPRPDHAALAEVRAVSQREGAAHVVCGDGARLSSWGAVRVEPKDGHLPVEVTLRSIDGTECADMPIPISAVAFLDYEQVVFEGFGPFIRALVDAGDEVVVRTAIDDLPSDGSPHIVSFVSWAGDGLYTDAPLERSTPWRDVFSTDMGRAIW